jgi:hypothetical protein
MGKITGKGEEDTCWHDEIEQLFFSKVAWREFCPMIGIQINLNAGAGIVSIPGIQPIENRNSPPSFWLAYENKLTMSVVVRYSHDFKIYNHKCVTQVALNLCA